MTASLTCYTQDKRVSVKAWQLSMMIDEVIAGRLCDTLVKAQARQIARCDSLVSNLTMQNLLQRKQLKLYEESQQRLITHSGQLLKKERWRGRKEGAVVALLLIIGISL